MGGWDLQVLRMNIAGGGPMKKWHMESIVNISETGNNKLAIPLSPGIHYWNTISSKTSGKELLLKQFCRRIVAFFLKFL